MVFELLRKQTSITLFNCSRRRSNYCKRIFLFLIQIFRLTFLRFSSRIISVFSSNFFTQFLILSGFNCSQSEIKFVVQTKPIVRDSMTSP